jgi:hypothetical protein
MLHLRIRLQESSPAHSFERSQKLPERTGGSLSGASCEFGSKAHPLNPPASNESAAQAPYTDPDSKACGNTPSPPASSHAPDPMAHSKSSRSTPSCRRIADSPGSAAAPAPRSPAANSAPMLASNPSLESQPRISSPSLDHVDSPQLQPPASQSLGISSHPVDSASQTVSLRSSLHSQLNCLTAYFRFAATH